MFPKTIPIHFRNLYLYLCYLSFTFIPADLQHITYDPEFWENVQFRKCCFESGIDPECLYTCAYYPPDDTGPSYQCMMRNFVPYMKCYTGGLDNTKCCKRAKVDKRCLAFCNGADPQKPEQEIPKLCQSFYGPRISWCNYDSLDPPTPPAPSVL
ncbi:DB module domain-containing protein [Ditylenchus destructor]|uniref:DB module domain-containing protein n=1 Tax=Ditylenchus destructor TaxID=166010 RepID=A0AAD4R3K8_9BILA|nr:DB module domain-containing protein [Ditylenchus destructor]